MQWHARAMGLSSHVHSNLDIFETTYFFLSEFVWTGVVLA